MKDAAHWLEALRGLDIDRPVRITLARTWGALGVWEKVKFVTNVAGGAT